VKNLPLPRRYRGDSVKNLTLPHRHRHRGSGGSNGSAAMDISVSTYGKAYMKKCDYRILT
jgi:hypothetical protein